MRNILRNKMTLSVLAYALLTLIYTWPMLGSGNHQGFWDWDGHLFFHAAVFKSVYEYGNLPFWNPWHCGGNTLWQSPQVPLLSVAYLFMPFMGVPIAVKLSLSLTFFAAFIGMHQLSSFLGVRSSLLKIYLSGFFLFSGSIALHLTVGHMNFMPLLYAPWLLLYFLKAHLRLERRYIVYSAMVGALMIYNGGLHIFIMTSLGLCILSGVYSLLGRSWRTFFLLPQFGIMSACLAAPKLLPVYLYVTNPTTIDLRGNHEILEPIGNDFLWRMFFDSNVPYDSVTPGYRWAWWEYGNYIGIFAGFVLLLAILWVLVYRRKVLPLAIIVTGALILLLAKGDFSHYAPYTFLHSLPFFNKLRVPSRHAMLLPLYGSLVLAFVFARWERLTCLRKDWLSPRLLQIFSVVCLFSLVLPFWTNRLYFNLAFTRDVISSEFHLLSRPSAPVAVANANPVTDTLATLLQNRSIVPCYDGLRVPSGYDMNHPHLFSEEFLPRAQLDFQPRAMSLHFPGYHPKRVYLNQSYTDGWESDQGPLAFDEERRLLFVEIAPDVEAVRFSFVPPGLNAGFLVFLVTLLLTSGYAYYKKSFIRKSDDT